MTCEQCRERLLEADIDELRGEADGPFGEHLRSCASCRRRARLIVAEHDRLAAALAAVEGSALRRRRRHGWTNARRAAAVLLPLAAALGALFVARSDGEPDVIDPATLYAALHPPRPVIETGPGVRAAVVTTDQKLTLVLLYQGDR